MNTKDYQKFVTFMKSKSVICEKLALELHIPQDCTSFLSIQTKQEKRLPARLGFQVFLLCQFSSNIYQNINCR